MSYIKLKFMFLVCQFIGDWYSSQFIGTSILKERLKSVEELMLDIKTEYEEE